jgi:hypothetical protein
MMALNLTTTYFIGHDPLNSLFSLSSLAHELGHSTTPREKSLVDLFLSFSESQGTTVIVNDENDAYFYEKVFLEHVDELLGELKIELTGDLSALLSKRKSIQYNVHLLANDLNYMFFSGTPLDLISAEFCAKMKMIFPDFVPQDDFAWIDYATLDKPLSKVGFLKAYKKNF